MKLLIKGQSNIDDTNAKAKDSVVENEASASFGFLTVKPASDIEES